MSILFLDTSALVKRYFTEKGSTWMIAQCQPSANHALIISRVALIEAVATFCRKTREPDPAQRITLEERDRLITFFRKYASKQYDIINVATPLYLKAGNLCRIHPLRAYDAIQLACSLTVRDRLIDSGQPAPVFVSADDKLLEIAKAEGFAVDNPNNYR